MEKSRWDIWLEIELNINKILVKYDLKEFSLKDTVLSEFRNMVMDNIDRFDLDDKIDIELSFMSLLCTIL